MLFTNDELKSIYDFEHDPDEIPDSMANLTDLAQNINDVIYQLCRIISDNDEKKKIYGDEVYRRAGEIKENKKDTITNKIESYFYIKSLHNRGRNGKQKIAILENETMKIEVKIVEDFFEKNKQELYKYFDDYTKIKCEVIVEKDEDGNIVNGILNNIVK